MVSDITWNMDNRIVYYLPKRSRMEGGVGRQGMRRRNDKGWKEREKRRWKGGEYGLRV